MDDLQELRESTDLPPATREWIEKAKLDSVKMLGTYHAPSEETPVAYITLYVQDIYCGIPSWLWWSTVPTLRILLTLGHEVAHHLFHTRGYIFSPSESADEEESNATAYGNKVLERVMRHQTYKLGRWCIKELAFWYYSNGLIDSQKNNFVSAADHFYKAWVLDPTLEDVGKYYWLSREKAEGI
jgi:hypothetical protein